MNIQGSLNKLLGSFAKKQIDISDDLSGLKIPQTREPFPIYPQDSWRGIENYEGNLYIANIYWAKGGGEFENHKHPDTDEHAIVLEGTCILYQDGLPPITLYKGDRYTVRKGVYHSMKWITDCTCKFTWEPPFINNEWDWKSPSTNTDISISPTENR